MKIAIIYKSLTGNTKLVAQAIQNALSEDEVIYAGEPQDTIEADLYLIGTWIDKGNCAKEIAEFAGGLNGKKIAVFATAGFGGSKEYFDALEERIRAQVPKTNQIEGFFFCQGKMPMSVRERYVSMMQANPEDKKLQVRIKNFDEALNHPNEDDLQAATKWALEMCNH